MNRIINNDIKRRIKYVCVSMATILVIVGITILINRSFSAVLENDVEVEPNSELTYYLKVTYDGVDREGVESSDTTVANVHSGSIFVQDKIPEGLTFTGFVTTTDGSIGAVTRDANSTSCLGKVVDDTKETSVTEGVWNSTNTEYTYHGLHYNKNTNTVSFEVKNLQAGCELTVGIKTKTPATIDDPNTSEIEVRRDFYNFATAREGMISYDSNTVHVYMGKDNITLYNVSYEYTGTIPSGAPEVPKTSTYAEKAKVGVAPAAVLEGYTFSGWTCTNVNITNGSFTMPNANVVCRGSFTEIQKMKVTYQINGTSPEDYIVPKEKQYSQNSIVNVDSGLKVGDVFNGYRFLGWATTDAQVNQDGEFAMPNKNVVLTGSFEEVTYKVTYSFYDTVLPPNADNYLPDEVSYKPGTEVTLSNVKGEPTGYKFLGWYKENTFEMPEEDVIIYGEWKMLNGTFAPTITKEVIDSKTYYKPGDTINYKITVTNTANYEIRDVVIKEETENTVFVNGTDYDISSPHIVTIPTMAALSSKEIYANYLVTTTDSNTVENTVSLIGALADNYNELENKEYKATVSSALASPLKVCKEVSGSFVPNTFQFELTGVTTQYETWIALEKDQCKTVYLIPATYKIKEVLPQEYTIYSVTGAVSANNQNVVVEQGQTYQVVYTNKFTKQGFYHSNGRMVNRVIQN